MLDFQKVPVMFKTYMYFCCWTKTQPISIMFRMNFDKIKNWEKKAFKKKNTLSLMTRSHTHTALITHFMIKVSSVLYFPLTRYHIWQEHWHVGRGGGGGRREREREYDILMKIYTLCLNVWVCVQGVGYISEKIRGLQKQYISPALNRLSPMAGKKTRNSLQLFTISALTLTISRLSQSLRDKTTHHSLFPLLCSGTPGRSTGFGKADYRWRLKL